jgi:hypothetical protein
MTTYATLKSDIEELYPHSDYTESLKASFVRICEAEIRRKVRVGPMETTDESFAVTTQSTALPSGFISMRSVSLDSSTRRDLDYLPPARIRSQAMFAESGEPIAYTIEGQNIVVAPFTSCTLQIVYYGMFDALSDGTDTNWLLTNAYDVYLYGSLRAASEWAQDYEAEERYAAKFARRIEEVNAEHRWARISGSALIRTGGVTP